MKIRRASPKDFKEIADIAKKEYKRTYKEKYTDFSALRLVKHFSKIAMIYVAEIEKKVVGFIIGRIEPRETGFAMVVEEFAVDYNYQRKGMGRALMKRMEQFAKSKKVYLIYLFAFRKAPATKFYKAVGYKTDGNVICFRKKLK